MSLFRTEPCTVSALRVPLVLPGKVKRIWSFTAKGAAPTCATNTWPTLDSAKPMLWLRFTLMLVLLVSPETTPCATADCAFALTCSCATICAATMLTSAEAVSTLPELAPALKALFTMVSIEVLTSDSAEPMLWLRAVKTSLAVLLACVAKAVSAAAFKALLISAALPRFSVLPAAVALAAATSELATLSTTF